MLVVDAHEDIAWNYFTWGRDPTRSAYYHRAREVGAEVLKHNGNCTVGLPEWLLGHVGIIFATLFAGQAHSRHGPIDTQVYATAEEAYRVAGGQLDFYHRLAGENQLIELIGTQDELEAVIASWADDVELPERRVGLVPLMEGADPIRVPGEAEEWFERGLRIVGLAWDFLLPVPSSPASLYPQHQANPPVSRPQVWASPVVSWEKLWFPMTRVGVSIVVLVILPLPVIFPSSVRFLPL